MLKNKILFRFMALFAIVESCLSCSDLILAKELAQALKGHSKPAQKVGVHSSTQFVPVSLKNESRKQGD